MTTTAIGLLISLAIASWIIMRQMSVKRAQDKVIAAQTQYITTLKTAVDQQTERIQWQVDHIQLVEERNAYMEKLISHYITCVPKSNQRSALLARHEMSLN